MNKYQFGKIYKIHGGDDLCYIGSTCGELDRRLSNHKSKLDTSCRAIFDKYGIDNCKIELLEESKCNSKQELAVRERFYIEKNNCVNCVTPSRTLQEYRDSK